jgi:hypothetical protein
MEIAAINERDDETAADEERGFTSALDMLRKNTKTSFNFEHAQLGPGWRPTARWSIPQSFQLAEALKVNTSIVALSMDLELCPYSAIFLFLDFVQAPPRLEEVMLSYRDFVFRDSKEIQDQYQTQTSRVLDAILHNPRIKKLTVFGSFGTSSEALCNLLVHTRTLKSFTWWFSGYFWSNTRSTAFAIARGLARNSSLQKVELMATEEVNLGAAMAGIGFASTIESLTVRQDLGSKDFYPAISKVLHLTPTLKTLDVGNVAFDEDDYDEDDEEAHIDLVFWDLRQPACAGLEKLALHHVCIGDRILIMSDIPPIQDCNHTLQVLELSGIHFSQRRSVRVLWNLVGLKTLTVCSPVYDEFDDFDDSGGEYETFEDSDYWGGLIYRNKNMLEVRVVDENSWKNCAMGIVSGACGHESLKTLCLDWCGSLDESVGDQLRCLLWGNESLQTLTLGPASIDPEGAELLVSGLRNNHC